MCETISNGNDYGSTLTSVAAAVRKIESDACVPPLRKTTSNVCRRKVWLIRKNWKTTKYKSNLKSNFIAVH